MGTKTLMARLAALAGLQKGIEEGGVFRELTGIFTAAEPADIDLYRSLLPAPFEMPARPLVGIFAIDYVKVYPWPVTPYKEGTVALRCGYRGREGWHVKTMPVTRWMASAGGRALGFPKYVTKAISLLPEGPGWRAEVKSKGELKLLLSFRPGLTRPVAPGEESFMKSGPKMMLADPIYLLVPPDEGPILQEVLLIQAVTPSWNNEEGMVEITIGPGEPWAGLLRPGIVSPGYFTTFKGGSRLVATRLGRA